MKEWKEIEKNVRWDVSRIDRVKYLTYTWL